MNIDAIITIIIRFSGVDEREHTLIVFCVV
jgi:hypothetical protein